MSPEWEENIKKINGLWPDVSWGGYLRNLWTQKLQGLNQERLSKALDEVRSSYSSNTPQLKWVQEKYNAITQSEPIHQTYVRNEMSGISDNELEECKEKLNNLSDEMKKMAALRVRQATSLFCDWDEPLENWSTTKIMLTVAAIDET